MPKITLVLPYALPLPEFAPDLVRALDTPALASGGYDRQVLATLGETA